MTETLCTCTDPNCIDTHDCEPAPCTYEIWYVGEKDDTLLFANTDDEVISEIKNVTKNAPEDFPGWRIKSRITRKTATAPQFFARCGA